MLAITAGNALALWFRQALYFSTLFALGAVELPPGKLGAMGYLYTVINNSMTLVKYSAIFMVKLSYLVFFRKLIGRVRVLEIWWWVVLVILVPAGLIATFLPFYNCPEITQESILGKSLCRGVDFPRLPPSETGLSLTEDVAHCDPAGIEVRSTIYLRVNTAIDVVTDILGPFPLLPASPCPRLALTHCSHLHPPAPPLLRTYHLPAQASHRQHPMPVSSGYRHRRRPPRPLSDPRLRCHRPGVYRRGLGRQRLRMADLLDGPRGQRRPSSWSPPPPSAACSVSAPPCRSERYQPPHGSSSGRAAGPLGTRSRVAADSRGTRHGSGASGKPGLLQRLRDWRWTSAARTARMS